MEKQKEDRPMKMLNVGCGHRFHKDWINIDVDPASPEVKQVDIIRGLPFENDVFDVVYHSNVLEHLPLELGTKMLAECYRVLKPGGIIRVNVPDLEKITRGYLAEMERAIATGSTESPNYDWMLVEMFDQGTRNRSGGEMAKYLSQKELKNIDFLRSRLGSYIDNWQSNMSKPKEKMSFWKKLEMLRRKPELLRRIWHMIVLSKKERDFLAIGRFRLGGEIHYHMYDRFSLTSLLMKTGFRQIEIKDPITSVVPNWMGFDLDSADDGAALIIEARK